MIFSVFRKTLHRAGFQIREKGRHLGDHLLQSRLVVSVAHRLGLASRLEHRFRHFGHRSAALSPAIHRGEQVIKEGREEVVVGFHSVDSLVAACSDWFAQVAEGRLASADRQTAEQQFPAILSFVEGIFKPETKEAE
jgi:hypothetical protein